MTIHDQVKQRLDQKTEANRYQELAKRCKERGLKSIAPGNPNACQLMEEMIQRAEAREQRYKEAKADPATPPAAAEPAPKDLAAMDSKRQRFHSEREKQDQRQRKKKLEARITDLRKRLKCPVWRPEGQQSDEEITALLAEALAQRSQLEQAERSQLDQLEPEGRCAASSAPQTEEELETQPQEITPMVAAARRAAAQQMEVGLRRAS